MVRLYDEAKILLLVFNHHKKLKTIFFRKICIKRVFGSQHWSEHFCSWPPAWWDRITVARRDKTLPESKNTFQNPQHVLPWDVFLDSGKCFVPTSHGTYEMQIKQTSKFKFRFYLRGFVLAFSFSELVMDSFKLKPFPCTVCRKRFKTDNGRASHQRAVHEKLVMASRSKPFECTVCSKQFTTAKGRAAHHRAVHNGLVMASLGSKPFECTVCSKRFTTDNGRASHQNAVHEKLVMASRSKPFECTVCSKRFTTDNGRASHQRAVHEKLVMASRSKRFKCTICSKRFTTDDGRACHQIAVHVEKGNHFVPVSIFSKFECEAPLTERVPFAF